MVKIYVLKDPRDLKVRYVGATSQELNRRLTGHLCDTKLPSNSYKINWLRELKQLNLRPIIQLIEETEDWIIREKFWYDYYKSEKLTNSRDGGTGVFKKDLNSIERSSQAKFRAIKQFTLTGKLIKTWINIRDAELFLSKGKYTKGRIKKCVTGSTSSAYGFYWEYVINPKKCNRKAIPKRPIIVVKNDGTEEYYRSIMACSKAYGITHGILHRLIPKKGKKITEDIVHRLLKNKRIYGR